MNPREHLEHIGTLDDADVPLFDTALDFASLAHVGRHTAAYREHIKKMQAEVGERYTALVVAGADETVQTRIAATKHVMCDKYGYEGDRETYNDLRNADMMDVIDRRKGIPISLAILALECARAQGWDVKGINFPGHFLIRFDDGGTRVMCDPFQSFKILQAPDLRQIVKSVMGPQAELSVSFYQDVANREILLRLQNNIKYRQIESEDYAGALETVMLMQSFAPAEYRLFLDEGVLHARLGQNDRAIAVVEKYLNAVTNPGDKYDAELLLRTLRERLD